MNADRSRLYAVTVKGTGKADPTFAETVNAIDSLKTQFGRKGGISIGELVFERDSKHRIHAHFTVRYRAFRFTDFRMIGWHLNFQHLKTTEDLNRWTNYLKKSRQSIPLLQQDDALNYYKSTNGFLEL